ncbi:CU044_2847 family protein [Streptomyces angustmyceticus]|uniref:CU044_2847 family protein n=1 Tax=Streptomyces angustmyceticus TaxID=285578 RepID=UPI0021AE52B4|nr:CU044_2847 family protein [Streptomyces angustmyceticus]
MTYVVELPLDAGGEGAGQVVKVEVQEQPSDGLVKVARPGQVVARATRTMGDMLSGVRPVAQQLVNTFGEMAHGPQEITVEFGLSLSAEADIVISSSTAQANFSVVLKWDRSGNRTEETAEREG